MTARPEADLGEPTHAEYFFWWAAAMVAASGMLAGLIEYGPALVGVMR